MTTGRTSSRDSVLTRIREALLLKTERPIWQDDKNSCFKRSSEPLVRCFTQEFTRLLGTVLICSKHDIRSIISNLYSEKKWGKIFYSTREHKIDLRLEGLPFISDNDMHSADAAITGCECFVARTGSVVISSSQPSGRILSVYTPIHIVVGFTSQVVEDIDDAICLLEKNYGTNFPSAISFASGPSRTGDIEKTLVVGVHGPKEVYVLLIDDSL